MKRILALLLAIIMIFTLAACGNNTADDTDGGTTANTESSTSGTEETTETTSATEGTEESTPPTEETQKPTEGTESTTKPTENSKPTESTKPTEETVPPHTHSYSKATCTTPETCTCGATKGSALGHDWNAATYTAPKTCKTCGITEGSAKEYTKGLKYGDCMWGNGYSVWGIGTATDTNIIIPSTYEGKPVIEIYENAFKDCKNIKSVSIPSSVLEIGTSAFSGCISLETVSIPNGVTSIYSKAFYNCDSLRQLTIPNSIGSISKDSFENCDNLNYNEFNNGLYLGNQNNPYFALITAKPCEQLSINNKTVLVAHNALSDNLQIKEVLVSDSVRFIGRYAFMGCKNLTTITFGNGLERIYINAFKDCKSLESAVFSQNQTWGVNKYGYGTNLTTISTNDASTNANNLKDKYCDYFWGR